METNLYIQAANLLESGQKIILVRIIGRSGSTPRDVGSMCIITEQGKLLGTVGGGALEYQVQKQAMTLLNQAKSFIYRFELKNEDLAENGMICGGNVDLYLEPLFPSNKAVLSLFKALRQCICGGKTGILATRIEDGIPAMDTGTRVFVQEDGTTFGALPGLDMKKIHLDKDSPYDLICFEDQGVDLFVEKIAKNPEILLFGAGHVSVCVAELAKKVGFDIIVIDDRAEFANRERFPSADEILVTDFKQAFEKLNISHHSYILIITRGHIHDKTVLELSISTPASYIGMIGSMKKRNIIYKNLMDNGVPQKTLETVYSPIGLDINAETPEEIAVSIVGELIQKRAPKRKKKNLIL